MEKMCEPPSDRNKPVFESVWIFSSWSLKVLKRAKVVAIARRWSFLLFFYFISAKKDHRNYK